MTPQIASVNRTVLEQHRTKPVGSIKAESDTESEPEMLPRCNGHLPRCLPIPCTKPSDTGCCQATTG